MTNGVALDLTRSHFQSTRGDITVHGNWITNDDHETEPCLVLVPSFRVGWDRTVPCCIALSAAFRYTDAAYLSRAAHNIALTLGFEATMSRCVKIGELILDYIPDLFQIPPKPTERGAVIGDASVVVDGKVRETELFEER